MRLSTRRLLLTALAGYLVTTSALADIVVIVNKANPVRSLNADQLEKIFLAKINTFPDGGTAIPLDLPKGELRDLFYLRITGGKNSNQLKAYWSRIVFTSAGQPPFEAESAQEVVAMVQQNPYRLGYVDRASVNNSVRIIFAIP